MSGDRNGGNSSPVLSQLPDYIRQGLQPHVVEVLSRTPLRLVVAHSYDKQIMYAEIIRIKRDKGDDKLEFATMQQQIIYEGIVINAIPVKITKYESPIITTTTKYDIVFESLTGIRIVTGPATIDEILSLLKSNGYVYDFRAAEKVLPAILNGYYRDNKMEIRSELETPGFYLIDGKVQVYGYTPRVYTERDVVACTKLLDDLVNRYKRPEIFASLIKWGLIAPFSYVLKQMKNKTLCLPWKYDYGETHAGKTTNGEIVLKIWRIDDSDHNKGFTSVDTIPRMGYAIMHGTFPMLINEVDLTDPRKRDLVEAIKNAVYDETFRSKVEGSRLDHYRTYPALSAFYLTGNQFPPDDTAFQRRIFPTYYSHNDIPAEKKEFEALLKEHGDKLGTLGDFTTEFMLDNNNRLEKDWRQLATEILIAFYKAAGREEAPPWVNLLSAETQLEDIVEAQKQGIRGFMIKLVNDTHAKHFMSLTSSEDREHQRNVDFQRRLIFCLDKCLIQFLTRKDTDAGEVIVLHDIVTELKRHGIDYISSLPQLQPMIGGGSKYGNTKLGRHQCKAITVGINEFIGFIVPAEKRVT